MDVTRRTLLRAAALGAGGALVPACADRRRGAQAAREAAAFSRAAMESGSPIRYGNAAAQFGVLRKPRGPGPHPVAVLVHGGFWLSSYDLGLMTPVGEALTASGVATWNVEYRRLGEPGGGWPGTFLDVGAALDHLRALAPAHGLDLERVAVVGHSAGGHLALWLAARRWIRDGELYHPLPLRVNAAVSLAGVADLRHAWALGFEVVGRLMGGSPEQFPARYGSGSPAELLPLGVPQLLVYGEHDRVVPAAFSTEYQRVAVERGDEAQLVALPAAGHFDLIDPRTQAWSTVGERVLDLCSTPPPLKPPSRTRPRAGNVRCASPRHA